MHSYISEKEMFSDGNKLSGFFRWRYISVGKAMDVRPRACGLCQRAVPALSTAPLSIYPVYHVTGRPLTPHVSLRPSFARLTTSRLLIVRDRRLRAQGTRTIVGRPEDGPPLFLFLLAQTSNGSPPEI